MSKNIPAQEGLRVATPDGGTTNVEKYEFEPIKGYPMLNWRGKRPFTSTQYYPAQLKEVHGEEVDGWRNKIFWGDNLQVMSHLLKEFRGKVDLIYIDPPFASDADYKMTIRPKGKKDKVKVGIQHAAFQEKQYSDLWTNDEYLQFLYERLVMLRELLASGGTIMLHCDYRVTGYARLLLDEVFGAENFVNEIVWYYTNKYGANSSAFDSFHNTLFFYSKGNGFTYNPYLIPVKEARTQPVRKWNKELGINEWLKDEDGNYLYQESTDKEAGDVWEVPVINPMADERTGYPTQKPEALLERVIKCCSNPGDLVLDCFMGSGTTQSVAMQLGRRFIGADINLGAVQTTTKRLLKVKASNELRQRTRDSFSHFPGFEIYNVNHYDVFRNPVQAKELLTEALEVQKLKFSSVFDGEKDGRMIKIMPVNRITTRADLNELIAGFDYKAWEHRQNDFPNRPVEKITLICMGHEPDLAAQLEYAGKPFKIDVDVVDILRDKADLEFKRDSQAKVAIKNGELIIERFYPMNLLQKLSLSKESVDDWKELVESVLIDWNYDGAVLQPAVVDVPGKNDLVKGVYEIPQDAGTIRVKITDLLSESWEGSVSNGD
ncbi:MULTISPECIES: DNA methyltransferase [unclassified Pseudomonas]|uniref:DNA methyltransferase n=1 Tax=unclassified Pseudomonas TaxID=196821 RepID=UPI001021F25E|nr:site-specific DNA-methyltransferase [Pseudomonas sp. B10]